MLFHSIFKGQKSRTSTVHGPTGFTLFELLISAAIFGTIMIIAVGVITVTASAQRRVQVLSKISGDSRYVLDLIAQSIRIDGIEYGEYKIKPTDDVQPPFDYVATTDSEGTKRVYRSYGETGCWGGCNGLLNRDVIGVCEIKKTDPADKCDVAVCTCPALNPNFTTITPDNLNIDNFFVWPKPYYPGPYGQPPAGASDCATNQDADLTKYTDGTWDDSEGDKSDASGFNRTKGVCTCASSLYCWVGQTCEVPVLVPPGSISNGDGVCTNPNEQPRATIIIRSSSITDKPEEKVTTMLQTTVTTRQYKR